MSEYSLVVEFDREVDGRWIADIGAVPGAIAYGEDPAEAAANAVRIASDVLEWQGYRAAEGEGG